jgi:RNA polymerase sigma-70 factor (ECF subfamily)
MTASTTDWQASTDLSARFDRDVIPLLDQLYRTAMRMTGDRADAEDLLQDAMLRAYKGFGSFAQGTNIRAWLYRILTTTHINRHRSRQRRPAEWLTDQPADWQLRPQQPMLPGLRSAEVQALQLPLASRMAVYYADVEGLRYAEIAEIMGTPVGTVMSRLHRGRQRLRVSLAEVARERGLTERVPLTGRPLVLESNDQ